mmetsp:Transcript_14416/g.17091  ORF Transcript_14416/g.17091 Transcript_14416/m.17091 type:complete len:256 (-) Transcript_14416:191-958(-)
MHFSVFPPSSRSSFLRQRVATPWKDTTSTTGSRAHPLVCSLIHPFSVRYRIIPDPLIHRSDAPITSPISRPPILAHESISIPSRSTAPSGQTIRKLYDAGWQLLSSAAFHRSSSRSSYAVVLRIRHTSCKEYRCKVESRWSTDCSLSDEISFCQSLSVFPQPDSTAALITDDKTCVIHSTLKILFMNNERYLKNFSVESSSFSRCSGRRGIPSNIPEVFNLSFPFPSKDVFRFLNTFSAPLCSLSFCSLCSSSFN